MNLLCLLWHSWVLTGNRTRHCGRCAQKQVFQWLGTYNGESYGQWVNTR